jgi:methylphosphotriester-DNA--protein-cysteine methyltransferase
MTITDTLKKHVKQYTLNSVAVESGIPKTTLHRFMTTSTGMSSERIDQLADLFNLTLVDQGS